ncbi:MAG: tRNA (adenosine(37)-N6)-dimethylallyltransferase MiaA, partial [Clostridia bacterium]|nr:tRNA (adenosine(37)-N6)-dimethylallyltransferase MiaA [Clostridia bacterium]
DCSLEDAVENLKRQTRRYAKRQLTWFRRDTRINWIYPDVTPDVVCEALKLTNKFL